MFKREVSEMLEGYYFSGPNPNLRRFVEEHATPYDPETDEYGVSPFDQPITSLKPRMRATNEFAAGDRKHV